MTRSLKFITLDLELGDAVKLTGIRETNRSSVQDISSGRGDAYHTIGSKSEKLVLSGYLSGEDRYIYLEQFQRYRKMSRSLKLSTPEVVVPVFIDSVEVTDINPLGFFYRLVLHPSRMLSLDAAETPARWYVNSEAVYTDPTPQEGEYCIQLESESTYVDQLFYSDWDDGVDLTNLPYIGIWLMLSLTRPVINFYIWDEDGNAAYLDVASEVAEANTWYRILHHQAEFTEDPKNSAPLDWSRIVQIGFDIYNPDAELTVWVDDLGAYE